MQAHAACAAVYLDGCGVGVAQGCAGLQQGARQVQITEAARAESGPIRCLRVEGGPLLAVLGSCQPARSCSRMATLLQCLRLFCSCCLIASICSKHTASIRRVAQRRGKSLPGILSGFGLASRCCCRLAAMLLGLSWLGQ